MLEKERIAIDITSEKISILVGTRYKITYATTIETPVGAYVRDEIVDVDLIRSAIESHLGKARFRTKSKEAAFILRGDDLIVRHITLPQMKEAAIKDSIEWELTQFVGERADEYNVSYEIVSVKGKEDESNTNLDVLMVAVEKTKATKYLELAKALNLEVVALDIASNLTARSLRAYQQVFNKSVKSVGVIDLGSNYSSFSIIERGKLQMEKYFSFGLASASPTELRDNLEYERFLQRIDIESEDDFSSGRLQNYFDNITGQFNGIIQFYSSGKVKKTLDKIYILGSGIQVNGLDRILQDVFNTQVEIIPNFEGLKHSVKVDNNIQLKDYYYNYALILRNNKNELNLVPKVYNQIEKEGKNKKAAIILGVAILVVIVGGVGLVKGKELYLKAQKEKLIVEIQNNKEMIQKNEQLTRDINLISQHIQMANKLEAAKSKGTDELIINLTKEFPSDVKVERFEYKKNSITITGKCSDLAPIEIMWANLRENDLFKDSHISTIANASGSYSYTLEIILKEVVANEQAS